MTLAFEPWLALAIALHLALPVTVGGILHMVIVTKDWWPALKVPLHRWAFGANKTWRGFVIMPLVTVPGVWLAQALEAVYGQALPVHLADYNGVLLGLALGLAYVVAELPNSFLKRRLGVPPGGTPDRFAGVTIALDQFDSALACTLLYWWLLQLPLAYVLVQVLIYPLIALGIKQLLFLSGFKKSRV